MVDSQSKEAASFAVNFYLQPLHEPCSLLYQNSENVSLMNTQAQMFHTWPCIFGARNSCYALRLTDRHLTETQVLSV